MPENEKKFRVRVAASPEAGFFRCGRHWPRAQTEATVTEADLKILMNERKLGVVVLNGGESLEDGVEIVNGVTIPTVELAMARGYSREAAEGIVARQKAEAERAGKKADAPTKAK